MRVTIASGIGSLPSLIASHDRRCTTFRADAPRHLSTRIWPGARTDSGEERLFEPRTLELGPFLWFGAAPGEPLPDLSGYPIAKHTKGNAQGVKLPRPNLRVVPRSAFKPAGTV